MIARGNDECGIVSSVNAAKVFGRTVAWAV